MDPNSLWTMTAGSADWSAGHVHSGSGRFGGPTATDSGQRRSLLAPRWSCEKMCVGGGGRGVGTWPQSLGKCLPPPLLPRFPAPHGSAQPSTRKELNSSGGPRTLEPAAGSADPPAAFRDELQAAMGFFQSFFFGNLIKEIAIWGEGGLSPPAHVLVFGINKAWKGEQGAPRRSQRQAETR
ncbi:unnamed protein product [Lepidochelys kempii]